MPNPRHSARRRARETAASDPGADAGHDAPSPNRNVGTARLRTKSLRHTHPPGKDPILAAMRRGGARAAAKPLGIARKADPIRPELDAPAGRDPKSAAEAGFSDPATELPHRAAIQKAFGHHDISGVAAHVGVAAKAAAEALGARAYASGERIAFSSAPSLSLAAHEAAHVIQQRAGLAPAGGVSRPGDALEGHADQVADLVASGQSAQAALDEVVGTAGPARDSGAAPVQKQQAGPEVTLSDDRIDPTDAQLGSHIAEGIKGVNQPNGDVWSGIWDWGSYKVAAEDLGLWDDDYMLGLADENLWERVGTRQWTVLPDVSAAAAVRAFLEGLTICECLGVVRALEADAVRASIGDAAFDREFGDKDGTVPHYRLLSIGQGRSNLQERLSKKTDARKNGESGKLDDRPLVVGARYYFGNHPAYLFKHPRGPWQGENAVYLGQDPGGVQRFEGLGVANASERDMHVKLIWAYNAERSELSEAFAAKRSAEGGLQALQYDPSSFPDQITEKNLLEDDPPPGKQRGGIRIHRSVQLDADKIKALEDQ